MNRFWPVSGFLLVLVTEQTRPLTKNRIQSVRILGPALIAHKKWIECWQEEEVDGNRTTKILSKETIVFLYSANPQILLQSSPSAAQMAISSSAVAYTSPKFSYPSNSLTTAAAIINFPTKLTSIHLSSCFLAPFPTAAAVVTTTTIRRSFIALAARGNFERNKPRVNNGSIGWVEHVKTTPAAALSMALAAKTTSSEIDVVPEEFETKKRQYQGRPKKKKESTEVYAHAIAQNIRMSAHKVRRVIDQIRGRSYEETLMILELMPYRACYPIFKLVYSAGANAKHNMGLNEANLVISEAQVNEGTALKRTRTRARGRSDMIRKPTCHIKIVLKENNKYLDSA